MIEIRLAKEAVTAGENIAGVACWISQGESKPPEAFVVKVGWVVEGRAGFEMNTLFEKKEVPAAPGMPIQIAFDVPTPPEGPISYDGELVRVIWRVFATAEISWAIDPKKEVPVRVLPRKVER